MLPYIKVYLENGGETEIRKLSSSIASSRFPDFSKKLQSLFPQFAEKQIIILWEDEQGDHIIVSTDEELQVALQEMEDTKQKYYTFCIKPQEDEKKQSGPTSDPGKITYKPMNHSGVICDICNTNIRGFRYKCIECHDYDVCSNCEAKGYHFEHCMLRLPYPVTTTPHMLHHFKKFAKKIDYLGQKESSAQTYHTKRSKHGGTCPYKKNMATAEEYSKCPFHPYMQSKNKESKDDVPNVTQKTREEKRDSNEQTKASFETEAISLENLVGALFTDSGPEKMLAKLINKLLGTQPETEAEASTSKKESNEGGDCKKQEVPAEEVSSDTSTEPETQSVNEKPNEEVTVSKNKDEPQVHFADSTPILPENTENQQIDKSKNLDNNEKTETMDEWTIIDKNESSLQRRDTTSPAKEVVADNPIDETVIKPSAPLMNQLYPSLSEGNKVYHSDPAIQSAVEQMIAMGYSNTGGVLTYLLDAENGNIAKVLDKLERIQS